MGIKSLAFGSIEIEKKKIFYRHKAPIILEDVDIENSISF